ncbi:ATP synthase, H+ transporting, mitochondrial F1 complex, epsilon subunit [Columba livia]|uniref:ATP synthase, H+ transporting, mitochondrial F1 complex, epsilon subunit n=4 Tax=Neoaves TaxID=3078114 RepID=A0A2I0M659_COLLI|nr:ATP synthase, H+ transporting, mitochondrial F1 complex, epsilon subunit [Columba livia]
MAGAEKAAQDAASLRESRATSSPLIGRCPRRALNLPGWVRFSPSFCSPLFCPVRSYIRYSQICAQVVRAAMKPQYKAEAERAAMATVKTVKPKKE